MAWRSPRAIMLFLAVALATLVSDLWLKYWAFENVTEVPVQLTRDTAGEAYVIPPHDAVALVPHVLSLKLTTNVGAVFGLGKGRQSFFMIISVVAAAVIGYVFARSPRHVWGSHIALALILGGALGNLYDRFRYNAVRDMLYLFPEIYLPLGLAWPSGSREVYPWIFNIADAALVVGVALMIIILWQQDRRERTAAKAPR